jgi:hypothetical protein
MACTLENKSKSVALVPDQMDRTRLDEVHEIHLVAKMEQKLP